MIIVFAAFGFVVGGVVNALADALPARRPLAVPPYLTRQAPLRFRDIAVHVAAAILFGFLWVQYQEKGAIQLVLVSFYTVVLLLVTVTDLEHKLIPDKVMLPALAIAALATPLRFGDGWPFALVGGLIGFLFFFAAFWLGGRVVGRGALGFGDVKLAGFVGLIGGFPQIFVALVVGLFAGGAISALLLIVRRASLHTAIPYGPFIVIGGFYAMVWGADVIRWYASIY